jgi:hypothetical protein
VPAESPVQITDQAVLRPGDTLLIAVSHQTTAEQCADLHDRFKECFDDVGVVVLTAEQLLVYRPAS